MESKEARSRFLVSLLGDYAGKDSMILEVGSRGGDNLRSLWQAGFSRLRGLESDEERVKLFAEAYPAIAKSVILTAGPVEEALRDIEDDGFDLVLTVGYLFDKEGNHSRLFPELARCAARYLVLIEADYDGALRMTFENLGMGEVEAIDLREKPELESVFIARVFEKSR